MEEEKKYFIISTVMFCLIAIGILKVDKYQDNKVNNNYTLETNKISNQYINIDDFGIYLQNSQDKTKYDLSKDNNYPTSGYVLNESKTECYDYYGNPQTGKVIQTDEGNVRLETTISIYCKMYFDIDNTPPTIKEFSIVGSSGSPSGYTLSTNVTYKLTWNEEDVTKYCIQSANNSGTCSWISKNTSVSTISVPLQTGDGLKTMYAFVKDRANNISQVRTSTITLDENNPSVTSITEKGKDTESITVTVSGSDGTGSGINKIECRATTPKETSWVVQDSAGNCKISGLNSGTKYTIEGRVTDKVGKVSTNKVTKEIETEIGYTCPDGGELVNDSTKGWICKTNGTQKDNSYWTCSTKSGTRYSSQSEANTACSRNVSGTCEAEGTYSCDGRVFDDYTDAANACGYQEGQYGAYRCSHEYGCWTCPVSSIVTGADTPGVNGGSCNSDCGTTCNFYSYGSETDKTTCLFQDIYGNWEQDNVIYSGDLYYTKCRRGTEPSFNVSSYKCYLNGSYSSTKYSDYSSCTSSCYYSSLVGNVEKHQQFSYVCDSGWASYSGSGASLVCFKNAVKG